MKLTKTITIELDEIECYEDALDAWNWYTNESFEDWIKEESFVSDWLAEKTLVSQAVGEYNDYEKADVCCKDEAINGLKQAIIERYQQKRKAGQDVREKKDKEPNTYAKWLVENWDTLKTSETIPEEWKAGIQKNVDDLKKLGF